MAHPVKNPPEMQEMLVRSLGQEGPLEKGMATHSSILAWKISRTEEPSGPQSMGSHRVGHYWGTNTCTSWRGKKGDVKIQSPDTSHHH